MVYLFEGILNCYFFNLIAQWFKLTNHFLLFRFWNTFTNRWFFIGFLILNYMIYSCEQGPWNGNNGFVMAPAGLNRVELIGYPSTGFFYCGICTLNEHISLSFSESTFKCFISSEILLRSLPKTIHSSRSKVISSPARIALIILIVFLFSYIIYAAKLQRRGMWRLGEMFFTLGSFGKTKAPQFAEQFMCHRGENLCNKFSPLWQENPAILLIFQTEWEKPLISQGSFY